MRGVLNSLQVAPTSHGSGCCCWEWSRGRGSVGRVASDSIAITIQEAAGMDKNLDWKLICFNIAKTTNVTILQSFAPQTPHQGKPAVIDNTWDNVI